MEKPPSPTPTNTQNEGVTESQREESSEALHDLYDLEASLEKRSYFKAHPELFQKMLRAGRILAGSLFLSIGPLTATQAPDIEENTRTAQHEVHKTELRKKLNELFGFDALRSIEAKGFKVTYSVEAGANDPVILHIGQTHPTGNQEIDTLSEGKIVEVQKSIQGVLDYLPTTDRTVFDEGISPEEIEGFERAQKIIAEITPRFEAPITEKSMSELQRFYNNLKPTVSSIPMRPRYAINHLFHERAETIKQSPISQHVSRRDFSPMIMGTVHNEKDVDPLQRVFLQGATLHCFAKQQCNLQPVANYDLIKTAYKIDEEKYPVLSEAHNIYSTFLFKTIKPGVSDADFEILVDFGDLIYSDHDKFFEKISTFTDIETLTILRTKLDAVSKIVSTAEEIIFAERERFALTKIEESRNKYGDNQRIIPLIYGNMHNFTRVVNEFNAREKPPTKYGLITLTYNGKNVADLRSRTGPK